MKPNSNDQYGQFLPPGEVRLVRTLPGPTGRVWEYLTDPEKRARWFAGGPMEPKQGGRVRLDFRTKNLAPTETPPEAYQQFHDPGMSRECTVLRWEPPRVLSYTYGENSDVTFELTGQGDNVVLVLTHRSRGDDLPMLPAFACAWHTFLAQLVALLEGAPRPAFWPLHTRLETEYKNLHTAAA